MYVAGPMTGREDFNYPAFHATAAAITGYGHVAVNPADDPDTSQPWAYYLRRDVVRLATCDAVCLLPGWRESRGARLEVSVARELGMPLLRDSGTSLVPLVEVVGITGYARSGKDSVAATLAGRGYTRLALADGVRAAAERLNPIFDRRPLSTWLAALGWETTKTSVPGVREYLQALGTEVGREMLGVDVWTRAAERRMWDGGRFVVPDVRFASEAAWVRSFGGTVWRVERPGVGPVNGHSSESGDGIEPDRVIVNGGSLADLAAAV